MPKPMVNINILTIALLLLICVLSQASDQELMGFQDRLAYERHVDEDTVEVVYYENGTENVFPIAVTDCYEVFTTNHELQTRLMLVSQKENPETLTAYDMLSAEIVFQRTWEATWIPCRFRWLDGYIGVTILESYDFSRLDAAGNILDIIPREEVLPFPIGVGLCGGPITMSCDEVEVLLAQWIPDFPDANSFFEHYYPFFSIHYSPYIVISVHLDDNQNIVRNGQGSRYTVILDLEIGEIIEVLENAPLLEATSRFLGGIHSQDFAWSFSGDYLFYVSDYVMVYDIVEDEYLVEIDLNHEFSSADVVRMTRWSANNRYVAFSLDIEELESERFIAAIDVLRAELYISELPYEISPYLLIRDNLNVNNLIWISGQFRLAWVSPEHELIIYDVQTDSISILDENVVWIIGS